MPADAGADILRRARNAAAASGLGAALITASRTEVAPGGPGTVLAVGLGPVDDVDARSKSDASSGPPRGARGATAGRPPVLAAPARRGGGHLPPAARE